MIHGSTRNKTLITGTLLLPKIKQKHLDRTNGRFWWSITTHLKSMQGIFWDIVQLQGQFRIFSLETNWGRFFLQHSWWAVPCQHALCMRYGEEKIFLFSRHDSWFQPSHKVWLGSFMLGTAGSLQHPPGEEGNSLLVRDCVLGMPELHITTEIMNSATTNSENHAVAASIRRGKVSPWWEKVFLPWN